MISRCYLKRCREYKYYGGRGIQVCDEWHGNPERFLNCVEYVSQLEHSSEKNYSLDRIDVNGNYKSGNVRWASYRQQAKNRRCSVVVDGKNLNELSEETCIAVLTFSKRRHKGERGERLLRPSCPNLPVTDGEDTRACATVLHGGQSLLRRGRQQFIRVNQQVAEQDPITGVVVHTLNDLSHGEFDIVIAEVKASTTRRQAQMWELVDNCN